MAEIKLFLFGAPRLERNGATAEADTRKAIALLAYLALTSQPQRRDTLAALLWPDHDQSSARGALRRTLSALNKALGGTGLAGKPDGPRGWQRGQPRAPTFPGPAGRSAGHAPGRGAPRPLLPL